MDNVVPNVVVTGSHDLLCSACLLKITPQVLIVFMPIYKKSLPSGRPFFACSTGFQRNGSALTFSEGGECIHGSLDFQVRVHLSFYIMLILACQVGCSALLSLITHLGNIASLPGTKLVLLC
jgi:hypothetical protein